MLQSRPVLGRGVFSLAPACNVLFVARAFCWEHFTPPCLVERWELHTTACSFKNVLFLLLRGKLRSWCIAVVLPSLAVALSVSLTVWVAGFD